MNDDNLDRLAAAAPEGSAQGPGRMLREARERKQLSLQAVADALHLRVPVIEALEQDSYGDLPLTFAKGYLKAYAKLVEVPEAEVKAAFERLHAPAADEIPVVAAAGAAMTGGRTRAPAPARKRGQAGGLVLALLLVAAAGVGLWSGREWLEQRFVAEATLEQPLAEAVTAEPVPAPTAESSAQAVAPVPVAEPARAVAAEPRSSVPAATAAATPEPSEATPAAVADPAAAEPRSAAAEPAAAPVPQQAAGAAEPTSGDLLDPVADSRLTVRVLDDSESWMEIRDAAGSVLLTGVVRGPRVREFDAAAPFGVVIGNAEAVRLELDGEPVNMGPQRPGRVVRLNLGAD